MEKLIIIGSGPAGLTAAIYAARANLNPIVIAGYQWGGQLMLTTEVENYPGFEEGIMGPELMLKMRKQAERFGARIIEKDVTAVDFSDPKVKKVIVEDTVYEACSVIIATGASARWLNVEGEENFRGRGVSSCATCDGAFYKNKTIAVVGGGDSAMEEANFLTRFASKVYVIHRRNEFRASKIMQERVLQNPKIEVIWNSAIAGIYGDNKVTHVALKNTENNEERRLEVDNVMLNLDGVFVAIGHDPNTKFLNGQIDTNQNGYIVPHLQMGESAELGNPQSATNIPGVFVAGDVEDYRYRQAITAAGSGCMASLDAEKYLETIE